MKKKITKSSGNVFVDLGFDPAEASVLQMRSNLMSDLRLYIEKHKLTQSEGGQATWHCTIARVRPRSGEMGQIQPRNAHHP